MADRNYALLHSDLGEFAIRATIEGLERRLDPAEFARVSRSVIVRVAAIKQVRMAEDANCVLVMSPAKRLHAQESIGPAHWKSCCELQLSAPSCISLSRAG
jgi:hypothetical protein